MEIKIGNKIISETSKPYFIADIAANHDGDLNRAFMLIELAKQSGADAAKFQNFKANKIVSKNGFENMGKQKSHQASWKKSVFATYEDASISDEWSEILKKKCQEVDIEYLTSPYDFESVDWADNFVNAYKIGSGDITWDSIIEYISQKGKPVLLATGASNIEDVKNAMNIIEKHTNQIVLMQCNTNYTGSNKNFKYINLNVLKTYKKLFPNCILGLSDHTYGNATVLGALALGARVFEKHFTDDNEREGPDHKFSMNTTTWTNMIVEANHLYEALGDGIKRIEENEKDTVCLQRRAVYTRKLIKKGSKILENDLYPLRPTKEGAVLPKDINLIIGKKVKREINQDTCLLWEDIENV